MVFHYYKGGLLYHIRPKYIRCVVLKVAHKQADILGSKQQDELARECRDGSEGNLISKHDYFHYFASHYNQA